MEEFEEENEKNIVDRALKRSGKLAQPGTKKFPYMGIEDLVETMKFTYPTATTLFIMDNDKRDADGSPTLTTRKLRSLNVNAKIVTYRWGKDININACWKDVLCVVEKGLVTGKVSSNSFSEGETWR